MHLNPQLMGVGQCPHCSVSSPVLIRVWLSDPATSRQDGGRRRRWGAYSCTTCGGVIAAEGDPGENVANPRVIAIYPEARQAHEDIPERARRYLQQAYDTLHAPDAAAMIAGSAVDAMLKHLGLTSGSLYQRIDEAVSANLLTKGMADWAHSVRLGSNRPRHADEEEPHVTPEEAKRSVEFAEALGQFLFVLTAKIERGIAEAQGATGGG